MSDPVELKFDIAQDELPVFFAETEEHLQSLDDGLIQLERIGEDPELIQAVFRSAHTLKGSAGMIGHKRMVSVTHALETALDGLRKQQYTANANFVDLCLEAVDALRLLRDEVSTLQVSKVDVDHISERFSEFAVAEKPVEKSMADQTPVAVQAAISQTQIPSDDGMITVVAEIAKNSIASAARAMQVYLVLQEIGQILSMEPGLDIIETAKPVSKVTAQVKTREPIEAVRKSLGAIAELDMVTVTSPAGETGKKEETPAAPVVEKPVEPEKPAVDSQTAQPDMDKNAGLPITRPTIEKTVRTSVERLDNLMNLVGELITDRNRLVQLRSTFEVGYGGDKHVETLAETVTHIGRITDQLQKEVMSIRMLPISNVFNKFPRMVRDLAGKFGKKVELEIHGEDTEMDRSVIEEITDPLIHLIRNSVDHGTELPAARLKAGKTETAKILLTARHEQGRIILTVEDDGPGINTTKVKAAAVMRGIITEAEAAAMSEDEAVNLIFASGLSTASKLSDVSGRGVGMDIVRTNLQHLGGTVQVETWPGKGSRFSVGLPLTLAIVPTLMVKVAGSIFAIPLVAVVETNRLEQKDIQTVNNRPVTLLRNKVLPLMSLGQSFKLYAEDHIPAQSFFVVIGTGKQQLGLVVDQLVGEEEVVVKSLGPLIGEVKGFSSAAILGDGQVILIVDTQDLFQMSGLVQMFV